MGKLQRQCLHTWQLHPERAHTQLFQQQLQQQKQQLSLLTFSLCSFLTAAASCQPQKADLRSRLRKAPTAVANLDCSSLLCWAYCFHVSKAQPASWFLNLPAALASFSLYSCDSCTFSLKAAKPCKTRRHLTAG